MPFVPRSIRGRLLLWLAFLLVCVLAGFGVTAYQLHRINRFERIDEELEFRVATLAREIRGRFGPGRFRGPPPPEWLHDEFAEPPWGRGPDRANDGPIGRGGERHPPRGIPPQRGPLDGRPDLRELSLSAETLGLFQGEGAEGFYCVVWSRSGSTLYRSTNAPVDLVAPSPSEVVAVIQTRTRAVFREAFQSSSAGGCILAGRTIQADLRELRLFAGWLVAAGGAVLALGLGGAWMLTTRAIRPVHDIANTARRIADGNLAERIDVLDSDTELGRLAGILNSTFARLDSAFSQQRQFTADASHELRTPIAVIIAETQTTLARDRSAPEYRETVETCLEAAQQMRRLTQSLLELARFDAGQERLEKTPFDLAERVRACAELIRPLAEQRGIEMELDLVAAEVRGDPDRLCQVVTNLLSNAVHYNRDGGRIRVACGTSDSIVWFAVADTGLGVSPADFPHLFERFYRGDKARSPSAGRSGLGLAICKAIVDAHGGSIDVSSEAGTGSVFTVRLPS